MGSSPCLSTCGPHQHGHHHGHDHSGGSATRLAWALLVIAGFAAVEVAGGIVSGSLALLADAGHMITDAAALGLALSAQWLARKAPSERFPFGLKRAQVLAAFVNGLGLLAIVGFLAIEAIRRLGEPADIQAGLMLAVAALGLGANGAAFAILHGKAEENVNIRGALLHVMADIFGSVAAIVSALVIMLTGFVAIDAILSLLVGLLILRSTVPLLRQTGSILLQAAPPALSSGEVASALQASCDVVDVHAVRAWQLTPGESVISLHAVVASNVAHDRVLEEIKQVLNDRFGVTQSTVQLEITDEVVALTTKGVGCPDRQHAVE